MGFIETEKEEGKKGAAMQIIKKVQMLPAAVEGMAENTEDSDRRQWAERFQGM